MKESRFADQPVVELERDAKRISAREVYGSGFGDSGVDLDGDGIPDHLQ